MERFVDAIKGAMPDAPEVEPYPTKSGYSVEVSWPLNDDPDRPHKRSKTISIDVSRELVEDFNGEPERRQGAALARLGAVLRDRLATFDPNHNSPRYESPPVEHWSITYAQLFE